MINSNTPAFFLNMKISQILWVTILVGLSLGVFLAQKEIRAELNNYNQAKQVVDIVELSSALSAYVHEQQKERGQTAIFMSDKGQNAARNLGAQRQLTDQKIADLYTVIEALKEADILRTVSGKWNGIDAKIDSLQSMRSRIDALSISTPDAIGFYTGLNRDIIHLIGSLSDVIDSQATSNRLLTLSAFLQGKEQAGIERALGSAGYALGNFDETLKQNFLARINAQQTLFQYFIDYAESKDSTALKAALQSDVSQRVERLRNTALIGTSDEIVRVGSTQWFQTITSKINSLKTLEDTVMENIRRDGASQLAETQSALFFVALTVCIQLLVAVTISLFFVSLVRYLFKTILVPLNLLADGNLDFSIPIQTTNEFGEITAALSVFRENEIIRKQDNDERDRVLDNIADSLKMLSNGNFSRSLDRPFPQAYERLRKDFNNSQISISGALNQVIESATGVDKAAKKLDAASGDLAKRTESQAAALEQTAAALEQMTSNVRTASQGALETSEFVNQVKLGARQSRDVVEKTVTTMSDIETSSTQISQITNVSEEIAFQTNLLALNAGVEAARAGDAGRGFAVVAAEVRALAGRSADAAKEITSLIDANSVRVGEGVKLIEDIRNSLNEMVSQTSDIAGHVENIATASQEQAIGLSEINTAIGQLDQVTQKNAAMVDQTMTYSQALNSDADALVRVTSTFRLLQTPSNAPQKRYVA